MELAKAGQKGVYHGTLRDASKDAPITVRFTSDPTKCKYPKPGNAGFFINFQHENREYNYTIENEAILAQLDGVKGHMMQLSARGARDDATLDLTDVAAPGTQTPPPNRAAAPDRQAQERRREHSAPPPSEEPPMNGEERRAAKEQAATACLQRARAATMKISNGMLMALRGAHHARQTFEQESGVKMTNEHFQAMSASIFIALDRTGNMNDMPTHPLPPKSAPTAPKHSAPPAPVHRQPDPPLEAPEEDDIPF